jgi:protein O-GlcNAc transferase
MLAVRCRLCGGSSARWTASSVNTLALRDAIAALENGRVAEAAAACRSILAGDARNRDALLILALTEMQLGRFREARDLLDQVVALDPNVAFAWANLGNARIALGDRDGALAAYDRTIAIEPGFAEVHFNRAKLLKELGRLDEALAGYDACLRIAPGFVDALVNRGNVLGLLGRNAEALTCFDRCLALQPDLVEALLNRGNVLIKLRHYDEAIASYDRALASAPGFAAAWFGRVHARMLACDWRDFDADSVRLEAAAEEAVGALPPFQLLTRLSPAAQLRCARAHLAQTCPVEPDPVWRGERYAHGRIRVAYLSSDLRDHPIALLTQGLFGAHDRSRFETIAISLKGDDASPIRARLKGAFDRFIDADAMGDRDIARLIRELEVDIVVDLNGLTSGSRPAVFAQRPAPIQVNYLGYAGTLGRPWWDYVVADRFVAPEGADRDYAEKVVRMPDTFMVTDAGRAIADRVPTRAEAGLPDTGFVFCCFNNAFKITPDVFDIWMRLLGQIDGSVLWLSTVGATASSNLREAAAARGIAPERLVFAPRVAANQDHLARLRLADLFVDTPRFNAHTTAADALWAGVPVLTCAGATFASRVAGSLLGAVGLPELITHTLPDYEALALRLARDPAQLSALRQTLARHRDTYPLFDTRRFTRHLEAAYITMWETAQRGEPPRSFAVAPIA